jgi:uncharacterized integral membrane protein
MAKSREHVPLRTGRTRISRTMVGVVVALIFLVLLIIFIAQNDRSVPVYFLGANGHVSEAVALIASALAGAVLVLAIGLARVTQLRIAGRRHNRRMAKRDESATEDSASSSQGSPGSSS